MDADALTVRVKRIELVLAKLLIYMHGTADHNALINDLLRDCPDARVMLMPFPDEEATDAR